MPLELKGAKPAPGGVDRRYYFISTAVSGRRLRFSTGTRDKALAARREQAVVDAVRADPDASDDLLRALARGSTEDAAKARAAAAEGWTIKQAADSCLSDPQGWARLRSIDTYVTNCKSFVEFFGERRPVSTIDLGALNEFVKHLLDRERNTTTTVNRKVFALRSVLRHAKDHGHYPWDIPKWVKYSEEGSARQYVMTAEDEAVMFAALAAHDQRQMTRAGGREVKRDAADYLDLFTVLADVGCRLSQGIGIRWSDVEDLGGGQFAIRFWRAGEQKGGRQRTIPCTPRVAAVLARRRALGGRGPFSGLTRSRADKLWKQAKARTHLAGEPECVPHALRHTCATRLLRLTGNLKLVQEWLGHTKIETTGNIYTKVLAESKTDAVSALSGNWNGNHVPDTVSFQDRNPSQGRDDSIVRH